MTQAHHQRKSPSANSENCIMAERRSVEDMARISARKRKKWEKDRKFEKIPIFRGFILKEIKDERAN